jgi:hypothetical protein
MKKKTILIILFSLISLLNYAQKRPLQGSGKIIKHTYDFKDFDKISFQDLDGKIEVEVGKPFLISVEIDDNLDKLLEVNASDGKLTLALKGNRSNVLYIEETNIRIKVSLPEISVLQHSGNSSLAVNGISGRYFRLESHGNGSVTLKGEVDKLDINKGGNCYINAKDLFAKYAKVKTWISNGDVKVNVSVSLTANGSGNGNIYKIGAGRIEPMSGIMGNGEVKSL